MSYILEDDCYAIGLRETWWSDQWCVGQSDRQLPLWDDGLFFILSVIFADLRGALAPQSRGGSLLLQTFRLHPHW